MKKIKLKYIHLALLAAIVTGYAALGWFDLVWFDEAYTVGAIQSDFITMVKGLCNDVHPHLYYILLKLYSYIFGGSVVALRMFSVIFAVLTVSLGYTHIRIDFGSKIGLWFSLFAAFSPVMLTYALQIRMYTLGMFLLTLCGIYAWRYLKNGGTKNRVLFIIFSVLSAYTHYFAFFTVAMINAFVLFFHVFPRLKKDKKPLIRWAIDGIIQFALYAPGIAVFIHQISLGGADWIRLEFPKVIFNTAVQAFSGAANYDAAIPYGTALYYLLGVLSTLLLVLFGVLAVRAKSFRDSGETSFWGTAVCFAVIAFTLAVSIFRPIYYPRYAVLFLGFASFSGAVIAERNGKVLKSVSAVFMSVMIIASSAFMVYYTSPKRNDNIKETVPVQSGDIFIAEDYGQTVITTYFPNNLVIYYDRNNWNADNTFAVLGDRFRVVGEITEGSGISGRIWVLGEYARKWIDSLDGSEMIAEYEIDTAYYNYHFKIYLYEKG